VSEAKLLPWFVFIIISGARFEPLNIVSRADGSTTELLLMASCLLQKILLGVLVFEAVITDTQ
jgi:hypothetical protein